MSCSAILNDYDGVQHDYTRKQGLVWDHVFLPDHAPAIWQDRSILWNAVEEAEKTKDSRLAREFVAALPIELDKAAWVNLLSEFIQEQFVADGMCADVAIHDTDSHNPHAHIMLTVRPLDENGKWQHKTEKEYLCVRDGEERGFTAAEFKTAQTDGWEKQYQYKVGKKKEYMTPSQAEAQGLERTSKYPKSTKYGRQNPISERWNSEEQLVLWWAAWAGAVNRYLERSGIDERIDHRSHAERGLDEQPTIHEGVTARALERRGIASDRCELNRQIRADNALLRELKNQVKKLTDAVKNTIPAIAEAMESLREKMIIFRYQLRYIGAGKKRIKDHVEAVRPELDRYTVLVQLIRDANKERKKLLAEKKATLVLQRSKQRELSKHIATLTEELEELKAEKSNILHILDCADDNAIALVGKDIATMEVSLKRLERQQQRYSSELDSALQECANLKEQAANLNPIELLTAQLALRPDKERSAVARVQAAYGDKYLPLMMHGSKRDINGLLGEKVEVHSVLERLQHKQKIQKPQRQKKSTTNKQER